MEPHFSQYNAYSGKLEIVAFLEAQDRRVNSQPPSHSQSWY
uniref:Uncharacterized protein n=1 Tax=Rhizophora mucronata TaxID=61149 RepID=A0A2P2L3U1_RHIMU